MCFLLLLEARHPYVGYVGSDERHCVSKDSCSETGGASCELLPNAISQRFNCSEAGLQRMRIKINIDFDPMSLLAGLWSSGLRRVMASRSVMLCTNAHPNYLGGVTRFPVPDDRVSWSVEWKEYRPTQYTAHKVLAGPKWADPDITRFVNDTAQF